MLDHFNPCLEKPVSLSFSYHCLLDSWELGHRLFCFHHQVLVQDLRRRARWFRFAPFFLVWETHIRGFQSFLFDMLILLVSLSVVDHLVSSLHFPVKVLQIVLIHKPRWYQGAIHVNSSAHDWFFGCQLLCVVEKLIEVIQLHWWLGRELISFQDWARDQNVVVALDWDVLFGAEVLLKQKPVKIVFVLFSLLG